MSAELCKGSSPWKSSQEVTRAALSLHRKGIAVSGLSPDELLKLDKDIVNWKGLLQGRQGLSLNTALAVIDALANTIKSR